VSLTRAQLRTQTQRHMDSVSSKRWDTTAGTTGEIDNELGYVHFKEWTRILNANRHYRLNKVQPTTDANGYIALTGLTTGTGDAVRNFYRVILVVINNYIYKTGTQEEWALGQAQGVAPRVWFLTDSGTASAILPLPVMASYTFTGVGDFIWVNWYPTRLDKLSGDGVTVDFPDGYEDIIALEAAGNLLLKGGAEPEGASALKKLASDKRDEMLQDLSREAAKATRAQYEDTAAMWGGN